MAQPLRSRNSSWHFRFQNLFCFPPLRIKERFARNPEISADEDVEERVFDIAGEKYFLTYHIADECIFPCRREFNKPPDSGDRRQVIELHPDTHNAFHVRFYLIFFSSHCALIVSSQGDPLFEKAYLKYLTQWPI